MARVERLLPNLAGAGWVRIQRAEFFSVYFSRMQEKSTVLTKLEQSRPAQPANPVCFVGSTDQLEKSLWEIGRTKTSRKFPENRKRTPERRGAGTQICPDRLPGRGLTHPSDCATLLMAFLCAPAVQ